MDISKLSQEQIDQIGKVFGEVVKGDIEATIEQAVEAKTAERVKEEVAKLRKEQLVFGSDKLSLSSQVKSDLAEATRSIAFGQEVKANEALIPETDSRGGYLIQTEVADAIARVAASVGIVFAQAQRWTMGKTDQLEVPTFTGSFLEGEYLTTADTGGSLTAVTFGQATLAIKKWQLTFAVGNDLLADAQPALADWLIALAGEALANMADKQGLAGSGSPFTGVLNHGSATIHTMGSGDTDFEDFSVEDASDMIAAAPQSQLKGAGFFFSPTVWAKIRVKKDGNNQYLLPLVGAASGSIIAQYAEAAGPMPSGAILDYPVFLSEHLPANSASAVSTKFGFFGNLKNVAYGERTGSMTLTRFTSGNMGDGEVATKDQSGMMFKHRHALVVTLPSSMIVVRTAAS